jgi:hypothetical protein
MKPESGKYNLRLNADTKGKTMMLPYEILERAY